MRGHLLNLLSLSPDRSAREFDWKTLLELAEDQCVTGLALQGAQALPATDWPPRRILLPWIGCAEAIKRQNRRVNAAMLHFVAEMKGRGLHPLIVKGQVIAQEYTDPLLRQPGDIDVFFERSDWKGVERWLIEKKMPHSCGAAERHIEIVYEGIPVELHYHLNHFSSSRSMSYWQREVEEKAWERSRTAWVDGVKVRTLGVTDTLAYLLVHAHHHLLTEGVGLRQLLDMAHFIHNHKEEVEPSLLHHHLRGIGYEKAFSAFVALFRKYLGLPKDEMPCEPDMRDDVYADKVMEDVWSGGNFGYKNNLKGVRSGLLHSLNTARLVLAHSVRFYRLAPAEARAYGWHKIFWRMGRRA